VRIIRQHGERFWSMLTIIAGATPWTPGPVLLAPFGLGAFLLTLERTLRLNYPDPGPIVVYDSAKVRSASLEIESYVICIALR
jgi:hypothetical protein